MNRLQKKCIIGTVGIHLLLLIILIVGPAFYNRQTPDDQNQVLDVIPANLVDAAMNSGVQNASPPPPTPVTVPLPPQQQPPQPPQPLPPMPPLPQRVVEPPAPAPLPIPADSFLTRVERYFTTPATPSVTPDLTPAEKPQKTEKPKQDNNIQVNTQLVKRTTPAKSQQTDNSQNAKQISTTLRSLKKNLSSATQVDVPGTSSVSYANYKDALATIYYNAWVTPDNASSDTANTKVKITIAADGTVINAEIVTPSGDTAADDSVRQALNRVSSVPPLPDQSKTQEEFIINFNLKTKKMLE
jgi:TonB family protein